MRKGWAGTFIVLIVALSVFIAAPRLAYADNPIAPYTLDLKVIDWSTQVTSNFGVGLFDFFDPSESWTTGMLGGDARWYMTGRLGLHVNYMGGNEGGIVFGVPCAGPDTGAESCSGSDHVWSGDVFYDLTAHGPDTGSLRIFTGYGELQMNQSQTFTGEFGGTFTTTATSNGFRYGLDFSLPLGKSNFALTGGYAWYPSNSTTASVSETGFNPVSMSGSAPARDYQLGLEWASPTGLTAGVGYRWASADSGINGIAPLSFQGAFVDLGYRF